MDVVFFFFFSIWKSHSKFISMLSWSKVIIYQNFLHIISLNTGNKNLIFTYWWISTSTSTSILLPLTNFLLLYLAYYRESRGWKKGIWYSALYVTSTQQWLLNKRKEGKESSQETCKRERWEEKVGQNIRNMHSKYFSLKDK